MVATHLAFNMDKYNVQKTPQVDWKGILYGSGMYRKLIIYQKLSSTSMNSY